MVLKTKRSTSTAQPTTEKVTPASAPQPIQRSLAGTFSSFNGGRWAMILTGVAAVPAGGWLLAASGHRRAALALLAVLAVPGLLAGLFLLLVVVLQPRWN